MYFDWAFVTFRLLGGGGFSVNKKRAKICSCSYKEANTPAQNGDTTSLRNDSPLPMRVSSQAKYFKFLKWLLLRQYKSRSMWHAYEQALTGLYIAPFKEIQDPGNFCFWTLESQKVLLMESGILVFGIRNTAQGIRNPVNDWFSESKFY